MVQTRRSIDGDDSPPLLRWTPTGQGDSSGDTAFSRISLRTAAASVSETNVMLDAVESTLGSLLILRH